MTLIFLTDDCSVSAEFLYRDDCVFFNRATAHTREPIFAHNSSKDAVWYKKDPFWMRNVIKT